MKCQQKSCTGFIIHLGEILSFRSTSYDSCSAQAIDKKERSRYRKERQGHKVGGGFETGPDKFFDR